MALFTDGPISSIEDLTARDSQLLGVASVEGIDVTQKIALAQDEIAMELELLLTRLNSTGQAIWGWPEANLENVVVTLPLKLWHSLRSLELVYGDAYNSQLNDRYGGKRDQFRELSQRAYEQLVATGIGIASCPLPRASSPDVVAVPGESDAALADGSYYVTTAWVNRAGEEGACAVPATITTCGATISVLPGAAPPAATGWNLYVGIGPDTLFRQNDTPIEPGRAWLHGGGLRTSGREPGAGQQASYLKPAPRVLLRG